MPSIKKEASCRRLTQLAGVFVITTVLTRGGEFPGGARREKRFNQRFRTPMRLKAITTSFAAKVGKQSGNQSVFGGD